MFEIRDNDNKNIFVNEFCLWRGVNFVEGGWLIKNLLINIFLLLLFLILGIGYDLEILIFDFKL